MQRPRCRISWLSWLVTGSDEPLAFFFLFFFLLSFFLFFLNFFAFAAASSLGILEIEAA